jgi:hypothetical protein
MENFKYGMRRKKTHQMLEKRSGNRSFSFAERRGNMNLIRARPVFLVYRNTQQNLTGEK